MQQKSFGNISYGWLVGKVPDLGSKGHEINPKVTLDKKTFLQLPGDQAARKNFTIFTISVKKQKISLIFRCKITV
jgi:hypothetical protein